MCDLDCAALTENFRFLACTQRCAGWIYQVVAGEAVCVRHCGCAN